MIDVLHDVKNAYLVSVCVFRVAFIEKKPKSALTASSSYTRCNTNPFITVYT
jgi:hypothetical protein